MYNEQLQPYTPFQGWGSIAKGQLHTIAGPIPSEVLATLPETTVALGVSEYLPHEVGDLLQCLPEHMVTWLEQWDLHGGTNLPGSSLHTVAEWQVPQSEIQKMMAPQLGSHKWATNQSDYTGRLQLINSGEQNGLALVSWSCGSCGKFACGNSCDPSGVSAGGWGGPLGITLVHTTKGMEALCANFTLATPTKH